MQQRPNTIEGTKRSGRRTVAAPVEEVITQQGECSGGNRNNRVIEIGCDEGRRAARGLARRLGANASINCSGEKGEHFILGNAFGFCLS